MVKPVENQKSQKNRPFGSHGHHVFHLCSGAFGRHFGDRTTIFVKLDLRFLIEVQLIV